MWNAIWGILFLGNLIGGCVAVAQERFLAAFTAFGVVYALMPKKSVSELESDDELWSKRHS